LARIANNEHGDRPEMRPVAPMKEPTKKKETFVRKTGYLPRPPTSCPGDSYIFQISWTAFEGSLWCGRLGPWLIQQLVLPNCYVCCATQFYFT